MNPAAKRRGDLDVAVERHAVRLLSPRDHGATPTDGVCGLVAVRESTEGFYADRNVVAGETTPDLGGRPGAKAIRRVLAGQVRRSARNR